MTSPDFRGGFRIEFGPYKVEVVGSLANRAVALDSLHRDMSAVAHYLRLSGVHEKDEFARPFWLAAVVLYGRCFIGGTLKSCADLGLAAVPKDLLVAHRWLIDTRHKHVAHADIRRPGEIPLVTLLLPPRGAPDIPVDVKVWIKYQAGTKGDELERHVRLADTLAAEYDRLGTETHEEIKRRAAKLPIEELRAKANGKGRVRMEVETERPT